MSDLVFTDQEREDLNRMSQITASFWNVIGVRGCGFMFTEAAGWYRALYLCSCDYPQFVLQDTGRDIPCHDFVSRN